MKGKLYALLKLKKSYGLNAYERFLSWMVKNVTHEEYIRGLIELRDCGCIHEENMEKPIHYRLHYITKKGYDYLPKAKKLYLKELWLNNRWFLIGWMIMFVLALLAVV